MRTYVDKQLLTLISRWILAATLITNSYRKYSEMRFNSSKYYLWRSRCPANKEPTRPTDRDENSDKGGESGAKLRLDLHTDFFKGLI